MKMEYICANEDCRETIETGSEGYEWVSEREIYCGECIKGIQGKERTRTRAYALGLTLGLLSLSLTGCLIQTHNKTTYSSSRVKSVQIVFIKCCTDWKKKLEM